MSYKSWAHSAPGNVAGFEAIQYLGCSNLYKALTQIYTEIVNEPDVTKVTLRKHRLEQCIKEFTGISVIPRVIDWDIVNAAITLPDLDKNHPLLTQIQQRVADNTDLFEFFKYHDKFEGWLDRRTSMVGGAFSKFELPLAFCRGCFTKLAPSELAAITLHELGHAWCWFERIIDLVISNYAIETTVDRVLKLDRVSERITLIAQYSQAANVPLQNAETIVSANSRDVIYTHLVSETIKTRRTAEGDLLYSQRGFEFSCDQFAVRHGAGLQLVSALEKIDRAAGSTSYNSWPKHILLALIGAVIVTGLIVCTLGMFALILLLEDPMNKIYDEPKARAERIKREMIGELKNPRLDKDRAAAITYDIATLDLLMADAVDKRSLLEAMFAYLTPGGNEARRKMEFQQKLERLASNDLFVAAAKFKTL